jgi:hypothetical protein
MVATRASFSPASSARVALLREIAVTRIFDGSFFPPEHAAVQSNPAISNSVQCLIYSFSCVSINAMEITNGFYKKILEYSALNYKKK